MTTLSRKARVAGLLYLSLMILGPLSLIYIPNALIVDGNASATAHNVLAHESLFRLGIVTDLVGGTVLIFFALALYRLFEGVDRYQAVLVVILGGVMPAAIFFFNVLGDLAALILVRSPEYLTVFDKPQREALALLFLGMHDQEIYAAELFWGLWLIPLAILVYRSRFLPRFLAVWLILNGLAWLALSFTGLLSPHDAPAVHRLTSPARLGEIVTMLWLVIMGAKERPATAPAPAPASAP
jgi:hypothetical protein